MSVPRSKSAPHVRSDILNVNGRSSREQHRSPSPQLLRSKSVLGPRHELTSPAVEREDPFNLSNFFPSPLGLGERDDEWKWLQGETTRAERSPGYSTPLAEEDEWLPGTPPDVETHEKRLDEALTVEAIHREDKLGILTFGDFLASSGARDRYSDDPLMSPYSENDLTDDEALYHALAALRASRGLAMEREAINQLRGRFDDLFAAEATEGILEGLTDGGYSLLYGGIRGAMDFFDTKF
ncbi:hypothetical protein DAEQUDRAFT_734585 [Daedalea quercina L-15889]|uniref:Uncharacterized protein n=1 Tax=Daedalea quercina L-15889 TaxID=1314783 RepID=A0A165UMD0_9APHY|nr:hypothetical protein DAEQUDRAFT_734585 [Daedalea quercina L-15889]